MSFIILDNTALKQVTLKKEPTGEWFATFGVKFDRAPPKPPNSPEDIVDIDMRILKYAHDTDGAAVYDRFFQETGIEPFRPSPEDYDID